jgi:hypothetical protein
LVPIMSAKGIGPRYSFIPLIQFVNIKVQSLYWRSLWDSSI